MPHKLTTGYLITRDICEMDEPKETAITALVDLDDLARRIDEAEAEQLITLQSKSVARIESLRAEIERLKTVPMKYRRMAFNAQLQNENAELCRQLASAQLDNDQLRAELAALKTENATAWAQAHRLALELECLLLDTKDNAIVSKWWDSGMAALDEYQQLKPGAAESAEAWAKMRKEML